MQPGKIISTRKIKIDKAQTKTLIAISVSAFVIIFSIFTSKSLFTRISFQNRVITAQQKSLAQFNTDSQAATSLISSYQTFVSGSSNIIGGSVTGTGSQDGTNATIILDALPDKYDFPALATSIEKLLTLPGVTITSIGGTDLGSGANTSTLGATSSESSVLIPAAPSAIPMPFSFTVSAPYSTDQTLITELLNSIRPIDILTVDFNGTDANLTMTVQAQTYYQPASGLNISSETIK